MVSNKLKIVLEFSGEPVGVGYTKHSSNKKASSILIHPEKLSSR